MTEENTLNIFTDGSSFQSPRRGGVGVRFVTFDEDYSEDIQDVYFTGYHNATINQMELYACILALKEAIRLNLLCNQRIQKINIYTDSMYIVENYKKAMFEWPKTHWLLRSGRPVLNTKLWKELVSYIKKTHLVVNFIWVKGHSKNQHNKAVDKMARQSANIVCNKPLSIVKVRRKITLESVDIGCVDIKSQNISIRIITSEYLDVQRISRYKYEVISKKSPFYGLVDVIFSELNLKVGHSYYIKVNNNPKNPRIIKVYKELLRQ